MNPSENLLEQAETIKAGVSEKIVALLETQIKTLRHIPDPTLAAFEILAFMEKNIMNCRECGRPFWRVRRQIHCETKCTNASSKRAYNSRGKND